MFGPPKIVDLVVKRINPTILDRDPPTLATADNQPWYAHVGGNGSLGTTHTSMQTLNNLRTIGVEGQERCALW